MSAEDVEGRFRHNGPYRKCLPRPRQDERSQTSADFPKVRRTLGHSGRMSRSIHRPSSEADSRALHAPSHTSHPRRCEVRQRGRHGSAGDSGEGGLASSAVINSPFDLAFDAVGNLVCSDTGNHRIKQVDAKTGTIRTLAGNGTKGFSGDGGPAIKAQLNEPYGLAIDVSGSIYFADRLNRRVRRIDAESGTISTVAGNGSKTPSADGGQAIASSLIEPNGVAFDGRGRLLIADVADHRVRVVDLASGVISTFAGTVKRSMQATVGRHDRLRSTEQEPSRLAPTARSGSWNDRETPSAPSSPEPVSSRPAQGQASPGIRATVAPPSTPHSTARRSLALIARATCSLRIPKITPFGASMSERGESQPWLVMAIEEEKSEDVRISPPASTDLTV